MTMARKLRRVILTIEVITDQPVRQIRRAKEIELVTGMPNFDSVLTCDIRQMSVNVVAGQERRRRP